MGLSHRGRQPHISNKSGSPVSSAAGSAMPGRRTLSPRAAVLIGRYVLACHELNGSSLESSGAWRAGGRLSMRSTKTSAPMDIARAVRSLAATGPANSSTMRKTPKRPSIAATTISHSRSRAVRTLGTDHDGYATTASSRSSTPSCLFTLRTYENVDASTKHAPPMTNSRTLGPKRSNPMILAIPDPRNPTASDVSNREDKTTR
jgi:hypothetical protein